VELVTGAGAGARGGARAKIIVRVDLPALLRGQVGPGECREVAVETGKEPPGPVPSPHCRAEAQRCR